MLNTVGGGTKISGRFYFLISTILTLPTKRATSPLILQKIADGLIRFVIAEEWARGLASDDLLFIRDTLQEAKRHLDMLLASDTPDIFRSLAILIRNDQASDRSRSSRKQSDQGTGGRIWRGSEKGPSYNGSGGGSEISQRAKKLTTTGSKPATTAIHPAEVKFPPSAKAIDWRSDWDNPYKIGSPDVPDQSVAVHF